MCGLEFTKGRFSDPNWPPEATEIPEVSVEIHQLPFGKRLHNELEHHHF
jgi:hypothetical protein